MLPEVINEKGNQMKYKAYSLHNFRSISQLEKLGEEKLKEIEVLGRVFPFRTNNYVVDELIDWENFEDDPLYILNFPQREMLPEEDYKRIGAFLARMLRRAGSLRRSIRSG